MVNIGRLSVECVDVIDHYLAGIGIAAVDNMDRIASAVVAIAKADRVAIAITNRKKIDFVRHLPILARLIGGI